MAGDLMFLNKIFIILTILLSLSAQAENVSLIPIFSTANWIAGLNIPLRVSGLEVVPSALISFEVVSGSLKTEDCRFMQDPYIPQNFLLKCVSDGTISIRVILKTASTLQPNGNPIQLNYGPLVIKKIAGLKLPSPGGGGGGEIDPDLIAGQELFTSNCLSCHTKTAKQGRSSAQITDAITANMGGMGTLTGLTSLQINQISKYINAP